MKSLSVNNPVILHSSTSLDKVERKEESLLNKLLRRELNRLSSEKIKYKSVQLHKGIIYHIN